MEIYLSLKKLIGETQNLNIEDVASQILKAKSN